MALGDPARQQPPRLGTAATVVELHSFSHPSDTGMRHCGNTTSMRKAVPDIHTNGAYRSRCWCCCWPRVHHAAVAAVHVQLYSSANLLKPPSITTTSLAMPSSCRRARRAAAKAGPRCRLVAQCTTTCRGREVW